MNSILIVCHPVVASRLEEQGKIEILSFANCGPLGLRTYRVRARQEDLRDVDLAERYRVVLPTATLDHYSLADLTAMFTMFLQKTIRAEPQGYSVVRFSDPAMTHIYPMYDDDYLYASKNERKLLFFDAVSHLGLIPLFLDKRCWNYMYVEKPLVWGGSAVLRSEDLLYSEDDIQLTRSTMNYSKRMELRETEKEKRERVQLSEAEGAPEKLYSSYREKWNTYDEVARARRLRRAAAREGVTIREGENVDELADELSDESLDMEALLRIASESATQTERRREQPNTLEESGYSSATPARGNGASPIREL